MIPARPVRLSVLVLVACAAPAAPRERPPAPPSVLLITVDTLRADALGFVAGRNGTPNLDALAAEGFRLPRAVSPVPLTLPAHASLLTGLLPRRHGVHDNGQVLGRGVPVLAERFAAGGYATAAIVSGYPLRASFGLDRGFARYDDALPVGAEGWRERRAPQATAAALEWLRTAPRPFFLWVHYYDAHDPYDPPAAFRGPGPRGAYDGEVAFVDHAIGALRAGVPERDRTALLTVFTADHGESLGEHGERAHGLFLYDTTVTVPLVVHCPGRVAPGRSDAPVRLVDVAPTVLELTGSPAWDGIDGVSVVPLLAGRRQAAEPAFLETEHPWTTYGWAPLAAVRHAGGKYVRAPREELYDLAADPEEQRDLARASPARAAPLRDLLDRFLRRPAAAATADRDPAVLESLRALGYVGAAPPTGPPPADLADPKDKLRERDALVDAEALLRRGDYTGALARFDAVLRTEPRNRFATLRSGIALLKCCDPRAAASRLRQSVALDPTQAEGRYALADALTRAGDPSAAIPEWLETVRLQPRRAAAWSNLGTALGRAGRFADAHRAFAEAVALEPEDAQLLANRAFAARAIGRQADAARDLERAAALSGESFAFAGSLGLLVLASDGSDETARSWLARARPGELDFAEARFELARLEAARGEDGAARRALADALRADPRLRDRVAADPALARLSREGS
jgi:arylsulfatase A-like enzyme/Flp pilus assembly protein TadD